MVAEIYVLITAATAFLGGILTVEASKTMEYLWARRKERLKREVHYFGRPLTRHERKVLKKAWRERSFHVGRTRSSVGASAGYTAGEVDVYHPTTTAVPGQQGYSTNQGDPYLYKRANEHDVGTTNL
ncbi:hypothetical protein ABW19_dt0203403 [Dactylella cylindrospora]|nr:hypothetical protein ABW19_dt0203403 [Dactylella cylindrospora]